MERHECATYKYLRDVRVVVPRLPHAGPGRARDDLDRMQEQVYMYHVHVRDV